MQNKINININNFGPINKADIDINRINVIGGVNSSGKSFSSKLLFCFLTAVSKQGDKIDNNSVRELFENFINNHAGHFSFNEDSSGNGFPLNQKLISLMDNWDPNSIDFKFLNNFFIKFKDILEDYDILNDEICKNELSNIQNIIEKHEKPFNHVQNVLNFLISIEFQGNILNKTCINFNGNVNDYNYEFLFKNDKQEIKIKKPNVNTVNFHNVLYIDSLATLDNRMRFDNNRLIKVIEDPFHSIYLFEALVNNLNAQKLYETPDDSKLKSLNEDIRKLLGGYFKFDNESLKFVFNQNNQNYNILNIASGYKQIGIVQLLLSNKQLSKNTILFIDEPEINLHPSMQIRFAELLVKISKELGVIMYINSHSPYFIESIEVFSTKYKFKDEVNFYLTEKMENDKFNFKPISFENLFEVYNNLGDPYDELDEIRGKNIANHLWDEIMGDQDVLNCLYDKFDFCKHSVTDLSKTDENEFIVSDIQMYGGDDLNKSKYCEDLQTVDAIYPIYDENGLTLYFFEFKSLDLLDEFFDAKLSLKKYIKEMESCIYDCRYSKCLKKIQKKLISKKVISLKLKPLESLILLNNVLGEYGISSEELVKINKEYYVVSLTNIPKNFNRPNKDNSRRKGRLNEIFDFRNKISPFPFSNVEPLNEQSFISMINELEEKNIFNSNEDFQC